MLVLQYIIVHVALKWCTVPPFFGLALHIHSLALWSALHYAISYMSYALAVSSGLIVSIIS